MTPHVLRNRHPVVLDAPRFWDPNWQTCLHLVLRPEPANLAPSIMTRVWVPPSVMTPLRSFALPSHGQPTWTRHRLPSWLSRAVFITPIYSCSSVHHIDRPWLRSDSSGPSVQAYSYSPFTALVHRHEPFAWPLPYVVDRHVPSYIWTSWDKRYIKSTQYCQSLIIQGWLPLVLILKYYFRSFWRFRFIDLLCIYIVLYLDMQQHYESIKDKMIYIIYILEWREYT